MESFLAKRNSLLAIVNQLHVEEWFSSPECKLKGIKSSLEDVINPLLLQDDKITDTIHVEPGSGPKITCRGYMLRQKKLESASSVCEICGYFAYKLFPTSERNKMACRICSNNHQASIGVVKKPPKLQPNDATYVPNIPLRASNSWHFLRRDMCSHKNVLLAKKSEKNASGSESLFLEMDKLHSVKDEAALLCSSASSKISNKILIPDSVQVFETLENLLNDTVANMDLDKEITSKLLEDINTEIKMVRINPLKPSNRKPVFKCKKRMLTFNRTCGKTNVKKRKLNTDVYSMAKTLRYPGIRGLVTSVCRKKGNFVKSPRDPCFYDRQGFKWSTSKGPKYLHSRKGNVSYRERKMTIDSFLNQHGDESVLQDKSLKGKASLIKINDKDNPKFTMIKEDAINTNDMRKAEIVCVICKKVLDDGLYKFYNIRSVPKQLAKHFKSEERICVCCKCEQASEVKETEEDLKKMPSMQKLLKNKPSVETSKKQKEIVIVKDTPIQIKRKAISEPTFPSKKLKESLRNYQKELPVQPGRVSVKVIKNPNKDELKKLVENSKGKYIILQSTSSTTSTSNSISLSQKNGQLGGDITINGKRYKIDTEFKLNDLLKENENASKLANPKDIISQLPGILQRSLSCKTSTSPSIKIVNVMNRKFPQSTVTTQVLSPSSTFSLSSTVLRSRQRFIPPVSTVSSTATKPLISTLKNVTLANISLQTSPKVVLSSIKNKIQPSDKTEITRPSLTSTGNSKTGECPSLTEDRLKVLEKINFIERKSASTRVDLNCNTTLKSEAC